MVDNIWLDTNGTEIRREPKTKGRPRKGATRGEDGNWYIHSQPPVPKVPSYYIILDASGKEVSRIPKGRGRTKPDFIQNDDGNWYKQQTPPPTAAEAVPESASAA